LSKEKQSTFDTLNSINVNQLIEEKNGFKYLSWASAWAVLKKQYPESIIEVKRFNGFPYLSTDYGVFVEVSCTINGITESEIMPVLDFKNQPIKNPNAFDINKSLKRAMVKAIALHGLGLYIYEGEDLPNDEKESILNARSQLRELLKLAKKYDPSAETFMSKLSYDQLQEKINEYSSKEKK
jgi:hypothetical protein